jgi:hypothetical protein
LGTVASLDNVVYQRSDHGQAPLLSDNEASQAGGSMGPVQVTKEEKKTIVDNGAAYTVVEADRAALEKVLLPKEELPPKEDKDADAVPPNKPKKTKPKAGPSPFDIRFVREQADSEGKMQRCFAAGDVLYINTDHANFVERLELDPFKRPRMTDRLTSYLSSLVASHYRAICFTDAPGSPGSASHTAPAPASREQL